MTPRLSIVLPACNEGERLPATLAAAATFAATERLPAELLVVDDGSSDNTAAVAQSCGNIPDTPPLVLLRHPRRRGKGAAVRTGVLAARGEMILIADADHSAPFSEFTALLAELQRGADIAIGSRDVPGAQLAPPQPLVRRLLAWGFRALRRRVLLPDLRDTQCGFKLFRAAAAQAIFPHARVDGWLGDLEALALGRRLGFRIAEVGIAWRDRRGSRVRPLRDAPAVLRDLFRIRAAVRRLPAPPARSTVQPPR